MSPLRVILLAFTLLTGSAAALPGVIIVDDDYGGNIGTYIDWWNRVRESGVPVRFRGMCISACTIGLSLPPEQMCAEPTASFGFHLARDERGPDPEFTQAIILRYYPPAVQRWLQHKKLTVERIIFMPAKEIIDLGVMPACDPPLTS